jgi:hypothetical protein
VTLVLLGSAGWLGALVFLCCLGRAAARGDQEILHCLEVADPSDDRAIDAPYPSPPGPPCPNCSGEDIVVRRLHPSEPALREDAENALLHALGY